MGKNKFKRFQENLTFTCLVQPDFEDIFHKDHPLKGNWANQHFGNSNPVMLELGCGRGEYTVDLARANPEKNFIGIDIKGSRMWRGAKTATDEKLQNAAFLRTRIEFIESFFAPGEISEIWITFPDPQLHKGRVNRRLTSPQFLQQYAKFLTPGGIIHLKTDSQHLYQYTSVLLHYNNITPLHSNDDIYGSGFADPRLSIKTTYETRFLGQGLPITYIAWQLPAGVSEFTTPDFAPDNNPGTLDDNRPPVPKQ